MLKEGQKAPAFALEGDDGKTHSLGDYAGKPLVLFFYPKDNTPGCTKESCEFSESLPDFEKVGAKVFGVSKDSLASHDKFREKFNLKCTLLSDPEKTVHEAYGVWGEKSFLGKKYMGTIRTTVLIDPKGNIAKVWSNVRVKGHVDAVKAVVLQRFS